MNLRTRIERLESHSNAVAPLTEKERARLEQLSQMDSEHPDYDVLEHVELHMKSHPGRTYEQMLREAVDEW